MKVEFRISWPHAACEDLFRRFQNCRASPKSNSKPMMIVAVALLMAQMRKFLAPVLVLLRGRVSGS